jgi:flavin reductase (DIM6/NTAB) family NADH-FMN oxidoreductase RutF
MASPKGKRALPLSRVYGLLEPGPVVLVTTSRKGRADVMTMSWHTMMEFEPPLVADCYANLECRVFDSRMVAKYCFFVLEVVKAWIDPAVKEPRTLHHRGMGRFMVAGPTIRLPSGAK